MLIMSTLFALLHSKLNCNIWHVFCWHLFSLLFHVNKLLWSGILLPQLLNPLKRIQTYCKTFFLFSNLQAVNRWAALTGGGFGGLMPSSLSVWNWNELIRLNPNSEMCGWAGLVLAGVSPFMPCSSCSQIEPVLFFVFFFFQLILHRL